MISWRERFGRPQVFAVLLLLAYFGQCLWLARATAPSNFELEYLHQPTGETGPWDAGHLRSPLVRLTATTALAGTTPGDLSPTSQILLRFPFIFAGALLGASLWYVARRLYGNSGGYIALALYAFSPMVIMRSTAVQPDAIAAWGTFGCVFTGIAVAHTLYAPREVVLWNWRRILLLGMAIGLGTAASFATIVAVPLALAFMLYLVPERRRAALIILSAATLIGFTVVLAFYGFHIGALAAAFRDSRVFAPSPAQFQHGLTWMLTGLFFLRSSPGVVLLLLLALVVFAAWKRTRFFGNAAPLIVACVFVTLGMMLPHQAAGFTFLVLALPFVFVFIAGISADLLETRHASIVAAVVLAVILTEAMFSVKGLLQLP
jgi:4-amino-4-deoxy-L-arabinose transferase-like glycosyltransferase